MSEAKVEAEPRTEGDFAYAGRELDALAGAENYYGWLSRRFAPYLGRRVVEVGAGIGTFAEWILATGRVEALTLIEPAANNYAQLAARFAGDPRVRTIHGYLEDRAPGLEADALVAVNVLEHVEDDVAFLDAARRALRPGGALLLFVPAIPWIYGTLDRALDHHRRYELGELRGRIEGAGFRIERIRYANLIGVLAWFVTGRVLRRRTLDVTSVRFYDRLVVPWLMPLEDRLPPPLGQSLLAIARR